jgi:hypothetical protein
MPNYRPMVNVGNNEWCGNALVFATKKEAEENASDLMMRWMTVTETRVDETDMPVNYSYIGGQLKHVEKTGS